MSDKEVIKALRAENAQLREQNEQLTKMVFDLQAENKRLCKEIARLKKDSSNSSKPPSSDPITKPKKPANKGRNKRKRGGQKGHKKHSQKMFAHEDVDTFLECTIPAEEAKRRGLKVYCTTSQSLV